MSEPLWLTLSEGRDGGIEVETVVEDSKKRKGSDVKSEPKKSEKSEPKKPESEESAETKVLDEKYLEPLLKRLGTFEESEGDREKLKFHPADSLPAPRPYFTVEESFPPKEPEPLPFTERAEAPGEETKSEEKKDDVEKKKEVKDLTIMTKSPVGSQQLVDKVSVTFSQDMVPITSHDDLAKREVPVTVSPIVIGAQWRWVDTKTLVYEHPDNKRFPHSTSYTVTIPAGTKSMAGGELKKEVSWNFTTALVRILSASPGGRGQSLTPEFELVFSQRVDPKLVAPLVRIKVSGLTAKPKNIFELIEEKKKTEEKGDKDKDKIGGGGGDDFHILPVSELRPSDFETPPSPKKTREETTRIKLRVTEPLQKDTQYVYWVEGEVVSFEGLLKTNFTEKDTSRRFWTYEAFNLQKDYSHQYDLSPHSSLGYFYFNNPIDEKNFQESSVTVTPTLPNIRITASNRNIFIDGTSTPRVKYTITFGDIKDIWGQTLGSDRTRTRNIAGATQEFQVLTNNQIDTNAAHLTVDPHRPTPSLTIVSCNFQRLKINVYSVRPHDYFEWRYRFVPEKNQWNNIKKTDLLLFEVKHKAGNRPTPPGKLIKTDTLPVPGYVLDKKLTCNIPLIDYLQDSKGHGHLVITIEPPVAEVTDHQKNYYHQPFSWELWVQVTQLGVAATTSNHKASNHIWQTAVSTLIDGKPAENVSLYWNKLPTEDELSAESAAMQFSTLGVTDSKGVLAAAAPPVQEKENKDSKVLKFKGESDWSFDRRKEDASNALILIAQRGNDSAFLVANRQHLPQTATASLVTTSFQDRKLYRPGESVKFKALYRFVDQTKSWQPAFPPEIKEAKEMLYELLDAGGNKVLDGETKLNLDGSIVLDLQLPEGIRMLGWHHLNIKAKTTVEGDQLNWASSYSFRVEEFRKPEFEIKVETSTWSPTPTFYGATADVTTSASYFGGGPIDNTDVKYDVTWSNSTFIPPNRNSYSFTWMLDNDSVPRLGYIPLNYNRKATHKATTDHTGHHYLHLGFDQYPDQGLIQERDPERLESAKKLYSSYRPPQSVNVSSYVTDANGQQQERSTNFLVHPSNLYVGVRLQPEYVEGGNLMEGRKEVPIEVIVTDLDGKLVPDVQVKLETWIDCQFNSPAADHKDHLENGKLYFAEHKITTGVHTNEKKKEESKDDTKEKIIDYEAEYSGRVVIPRIERPFTGGSTMYSIVAKATVTDNKGRTNVSRGTFYVPIKSAQESDVIPQLLNAEESFNLNPLKPTYKPGEKAQLRLTNAKLSTYYAWVFVTQAPEFTPKLHNIYEVKENNYIFEIPIREEDIPNILVKVFITGANKDRRNAEGEIDEKLPPRSWRAQTDCRIEISTDDVTLKLQAVPKHPLVTPGQQTSLKIRVETQDGKASANASVTVAVVDESVLSLAPYSWTNPTNSFYPSFYDSFSYSAHTYQNLVMTNEPQAPKKPKEEQQQQQSLDQLQSLGFAGGGGPGGALPMPMAASASFAMAPVTRDIQIESLDKLKASPRKMAKKSAGAVRMRKASRQAEAESDFNERAGGEESLLAFEDGVGGGSAPPVTVTFRKDFNSLALWIPTASTDEKGEVVFEYKVPDNLTRYRIMVFASQNATHHGVVEASITARLPVTLRPSPPRFLQYGDQFMLQVIVQNQTEEAIVAQLLTRVTNLVLIDQPGRTVSIPAKKRARVTFSMRTKSAGTARYQVVAFEESEDGDGLTLDAAQGEFPVFTPATTEAFATYGTIPDERAVDKDKDQKKEESKDPIVISVPVQAPTNAIPDFGSLDVTFSSTQVMTLSEAIVYLADYPFDCVEQLASRLMGVVMLRDILAAFSESRKNLPKPSEIKTWVTSLVKRLFAQQRMTGGFGLWSPITDTFPFLTVHVAHALARLQEKGYDDAIPELMLSRIKTYLGNLSLFIPWWYSTEAREGVLAYGAFVKTLPLFQTEESPKAARELAEKIIKRAEDAKVDPPLEALAWLIYPVYRGTKEGKEKSKFTSVFEKLIEIFGSKVDQTARHAHFGAIYSDGAHVMFHSSSRLDAVLLDTLLYFDNNDFSKALCPKLVAGLLGLRKKGKWSNTQDNVFAIIALDHYFHVYENIIPDFTVKAWIRDIFAGSNKFVGRTTDEHVVAIPMDVVTKEKDVQNLTLSVEGKGRLYYNLRLKYAPTNLFLEPRNRGFQVTRTYEGVDNPDDVKIDEKDKKVTVKFGARVKVSVTIHVKSVRYHVALVDPLPAGFEAKNPALSGIPSDPIERGDNDHVPSPYDRWSCRFRPNWKWYSHVNYRDSRVEAFTDVLWSGSHTLTYTANATCPGIFVTPPAKAEEMYEPDTFGRSSSLTIQVV